MDDAPGKPGKQARALLADFERRDREGRFFACLVVMRCKGVRAA